jgi:ATP-dependent DNA helicase DinG
MRRRQYGSLLGFSCKEIVLAENELGGLGRNMGQLSVESILGPNGLIARRIQAYEHRQQQMDMAKAVGQALADRKHLMVEAGTGVGKSFAYLVPGILFATADQVETATPKANEPEHEDDEKKKIRRIVISTHTISLQEQLINKDLPLLNAVIPREFSSVLVKGRGNYISLRRLELARQRATSLWNQESEFQQLAAIQNWTQETADGSLSSLSFRPAGNVWDEVASDTGNCMGRKCGHFEECFYFKARRRVHNAQILVVNHALFFADLALRELDAGILPEYDAVILDECHTIESVASEHLGISVSNSQIDYTLRKLYNPRTEKGLLVVLGLKQLMQKSYKCMELVDDMVFDLSGWLASRPQNNGRVREPKIVNNQLSDALDELAGQLERFGINHESASVRQDMMSSKNRLNVLAESVRQWIDQSQIDSVYWIEQSQGRAGTRIEMRSSPIDIASHMRRMLFQKVPSVIMTSATLSTADQSDSQGGFDFYKTRIGASDARSKRLGSPFNFREQAELILIEQMPDPSIDKQKYEAMLPSVIKHYLGLTDGHAFVLFTSYDLLRRMVLQLTPWMTEMGLAIYSQADGGPRGQLLDSFKKNPRGALFGTESFWQGVDVPGDALRNVIITKLPFSVPDHPLLEARLDAIRERGGNPFRDYQLPEAVIKLRQGFGRLIRTASDSGIVVITDPRILTKYYGKIFLQSLPDCRVSRVAATRFEKSF